MENLERPRLAAYYFPGYHTDPATDRWHGKGWTEWDVLAAARPRFEGHRQPRSPEWGSFDEADPEWAARQATLARSHGIDTFLFDWYWYRGGPFLQRALEEGFMRIGDHGVDFALMWANHDWLDIHPTGRSRPPGVLFPGAVSDREFDDMATYVVDTYFSHDRYLRPGGCPYFSIYEPQTLIDGLGSLERAAGAIQRLRERTVAAGHAGLHVNIVVTERSVLPGERMTAHLTQMIDAFEASSATSYVWIHHEDPGAYGFPQSDYNRMAAHMRSIWKKLRDELPVPYHPNVTVGWDSSPRTVQSDRYEEGDYPWLGVLDPSPFEYGRALRDAMEFSRSGPSDAASMVTINAWNEWTEASYLLPDTKHGLAFLDETRRAAQQWRAMTGGFAREAAEHE